MELGESREDYLEAIYILSKTEKPLRGVVLAKYMGISKASVSIAMKDLGEKGYIDRNMNGGIRMTGKGQALAENIYGRHKFFKTLLLKVGVEEPTADREACQMEHVLSDDSYWKLKQYLE